MEEDGFEILGSLENRKKQLAAKPRFKKNNYPKTAYKSQSLYTSTPRQLNVKTFIIKLLRKQKTRICRTKKGG